MEALEAKDGSKINIMEHLSADWPSFAIHLDFDHLGTTVQNINRDHRYGKDCIREVVTRWLGGAGRQPATWEVLVDILDDMKLRYLAGQIRSIKLV